SGRDRVSRLPGQTSKTKCRVDNLQNNDRGRMRIGIRTTGALVCCEVHNAEEHAMETEIETLTPATDLARNNPVRMPHESPEYRAARTALLAQEIELRRHIERVAAQRRALPPGGPVSGDYRFEGEDGPSDFAELFGDKQTLAVYSYMFGPERARPCPMCTNLLGAWEGNAADIGQRISLAVVARSPIERLIAWKRERG